MRIVALLVVLLLSIAMAGCDDASTPPASKKKSAAQSSTPSTASGATSAMPLPSQPELPCDQLTVPARANAWPEGIFNNTDPEAVARAIAAAVGDPVTGEVSHETWYVKANTTSGGTVTVSNDRSVEQSWSYTTQESTKMTAWKDAPQGRFAAFAKSVGLTAQLSIDPEPAESGGTVHDRTDWMQPLPDGLAPMKFLMSSYLFDEPSGTSFGLGGHASVVLGSSWPYSYEQGVERGLALATCRLTAGPGGNVTSTGSVRYSRVPHERVEIELNVQLVLLSGEQCTGTLYIDQETGIPESIFVHFSRPANPPSPAPSTSAPSATSASSHSGSGAMMPAPISATCTKAASAIAPRPGA